MDDAEDGEVINHEYGHAIHFSQNVAFASVEADAISEGFGATSYDPTPPHCLRRVDSNLLYPENLVGQVHADGRIWSRALWDIRNAIGNVRATRSSWRGSSTSGARR